MRTFPIHLTQLLDDGTVLAEKLLRFHTTPSGVVVSAEPWAINITRMCVTGGMEWRRVRGGRVLFTGTTNAQKHLMPGDCLSFAQGSVRFDLGVGQDASAMFRKDDAREYEFGAFMEKHPDATPGEVWEAAFSAGHQTAYTLLTGDSE